MWWFNHWLCLNIAYYLCKQVLYAELNVDENEFVEGNYAAARV